MKLGNVAATAWYPGTQIAQLSSARSTTFTVNGSVDYGWRYHIFGYINPSTDGAVDRTMRLQPNSDANAAYANDQHQHYKNADGSNAHVTGNLAPADANGLVVASTGWGVGGTVIAWGTFYGLNGYGVGRPYEGRCTTRPDTAGDSRTLANDYAGYWSHTTQATVVTSLWFQMGGTAAHFTGTIRIQAIVQ